MPTLRPLTLIYDIGKVFLWLMIMIQSRIFTYSYYDAFIIFHILYSLHGISFENVSGSMKEI